MSGRQRTSDSPGEPEVGHHQPGSVLPVALGVPPSGVVPDPIGRGGRGRGGGPGGEEKESRRRGGPGVAQRATG